MSIRKAPWLILLVFFCCSVLDGETLFVYVEDAGQAYSELKEGLLDGLFEQHHVVFDDAKAYFQIAWDSGDFEPLIDLAAEGGAEFLIAVEVSPSTARVTETLMRAQSRARYFFLAVGSGVLLTQGDLAWDNRGREEQIDGDRVRYLLGEQLSQAIETFLKERHNGASDVDHLGEKALIISPGGAENSE